MRRGRFSLPYGPVSLLVLPMMAGGLLWGGVFYSSVGGEEPTEADAADASGAAADPAPAPATLAALDPAPDVPRSAPAAVRSEAEEAVDAENAALLDALRGDLRESLPLDRWRGSSWGVLVTSLDRGDTLYAHNAHQAMSPASNMKLLTTAAALHHLGDDYRFRTFLLSEGGLDDGTLKGDLILYGTGDPTLGEDPSRPDDEALRHLARTLAERGVRVVEGNVVGDGSYFEGASRPESWGNRSLNEWFATPVSALQFNENVATLRIRPGVRPGSPVRVETIPAGAPVPVEVRAQTVSRRTGHRVWALRDALDEPVVLTGQIQIQDPDIWRRMPVPDPALYTAERMRAVLEEEGIEVRGIAVSNPGRSSSLLAADGVWAPGMGGGAPRPGVLAEHRSEPLLNLLWVVNRESHNLYAESILRTLGRVVDGDSSFEGGVEVIRRFLVERVGVPAEEVLPLDGSGLSPGNLVSPFAFVRLLDHMSRDSHWGAFWSTLPQAGNWRELRRMYGSPAAENLRAKTGTLRSVSALSGVVRARNGERLAFSILANDVPSTSAAKAVEDRIGVRLASFWRARPEPAVDADVSRALEE